VWPYEIKNFLFHDQCQRTGPTLAEFWGSPRDAEEANASAQGPTPAAAIPV